MRTGTVTSRSIVKDLRKSMGTSELPAGLSGFSDAKVGERLFLFDQEFFVSFRNFTM